MSSVIYFSGQFRYTPRTPILREDKRGLQAQLSKSAPAVDFICELVHATRGCIKELVRSGDLAHFITALAAALKPVVHDPQPDNREVCPFTGAKGKRPRWIAE